MKAIYLMLYFLHYSIDCSNIPIVEIGSGKLSGRYYESYRGKTFLGFTGIPYAKPPVANLRFKDPVPIDPWNNTYDGTKSHNVCLQINIYDKNLPIIGSEDCLYLNVYTPKITDNKLLPVMFYIYGGSYIMGGAKPEWLGPKILLDKDIVLVIANYRLGALGFLSTSDEVSPGNYGLKDQNMALKWTLDNIAAFGGDPSKITMFGNSAGAASVNLHMVSPLSKGLIHGAILQSGNAVKSFSELTKIKANKNANELGSLLDCPTNNSNDLVRCLRNINAIDIVKQEGTFMSWDNESTMPFKPTIEANTSKAFLSENPQDIIKSGRSSKIPMIVGLTAEECAYKATSLCTNPNLLRILEANFESVVPIPPKDNNATLAIREFYFNSTPITDNTEVIKTGITNLYSDAYFLLDHYAMLEVYKNASNSPIFQYLFDYRGSESYASLYGNDNFDYGVCHTDELFYLFQLGHTFPKYVPKESDLKMMETLTTLWTNFATYGDPTPKLSNVNFPAWPPITADGMEYYHIKGFDNFAIENNFFINRVNFWKNLLD